jgi:hypothetical protein
MKRKKYLGSLGWKSNYRVSIGILELVHLLLGMRITIARVVRMRIVISISFVVEACEEVSEVV